MLPLLTDLSPNAAVLLLTFGVALIAVELNRPGWILPGASGLLLTLLAAASLWLRHPDGFAVLLCLACAGLLLAQLRRPFGAGMAVVPTVLLEFGLRQLFPATAARVGAVVAIVCAVLLGGGTTVLTRIARRARKNKGLD
jgi:membrane-bound ClpP family serine protease